MSNKTFIATIGLAVALAASLAGPVHAQNTMAPGADARAVTEQNERAYGEQATPGRIRPSNRRNRNPPPVPPTPEEVVAAAQTHVTAAGMDCQVTQANLLPVVSGEARVYEAACAVGPGYIVLATTPPQAFDCTILAVTAAATPAATPAPAGPPVPGQPTAADILCTIPQNQDVLRVMVEYGRQANLPCVPDEGAPLGKQIEGDLVYEVGCDGLDGYVLQRLAAGGWKKTECSTVVDTALACRYSTPAEQAATLKNRLASNPEAAACDVTTARYMGANANGSFYEAKCGAGNGVIVRFNTEFAVQQVYPCEVAQRIGGGCTLTEVPPLPADTVVVPAGR